MFKEVIQQKVLIPVDRWADMQHKLAHINRRLDKMKVQQMTLTVDGSPIWVETTKTSESVKIDGKWKRRAVVVEVNGWLPIFDGWRFVAKIDFVKGTKPMVYSVEPFPVESIPTTAHCEHCNHNRQRNSVLIVEKDGVWKQIGTSCAEAFLGSADMLKILNFWKEMTSKEWTEGDYVRIPSWMDAEDILTRTAAVVRVHGFVSRSKQMETGDTATSSRIFDKDLEILDEDVELAESVLEWYDTEWRNKVAKNDFEHNVTAAIAKTGEVHMRNCGIVCWLVEGYRRAQEKALSEALAPKVEKSNEWIDPQLNYTMTVISKRKVETMYGVSTKVSMEDEYGNMMIWWASGNTDFAVEGEKLLFRASIKKRDEYKGRKQTIVSHLKQVLL